MDEEAKAKRSTRRAYTMAIISVAITLGMIVAIIYFGEYIRDLQHYGYLGAFLISILGGATVLIPVPMLAIVFALGGIMPYTWLVGLTAALGEVTGAVTIYLTGHGAGSALTNRKMKQGRFQATYDRLLTLMEKRGSLTLFVVASVISPFFYPTALAAGALRFGLKKYILIVFAGKLIKSMTVVYAGYFGLRGLFQAIGISLF